MIPLFMNNISITIKVPYLEIELKYLKLTADYLSKSNGISVALFHLYYYSENNGVDKYLSPVSGNITTIFLPAFSGRFAN